jgi:hypothetical protein
MPNQTTIKELEKIRKRLEMPGVACYRGTSNL